jgi:hypothetical protein
MLFKNGPVLTPAVVEDLISGVEFHLFQGTTTMACALKLRSGFVVVGLSASVPTTQFDPQVGMQCARADAERKLYEHLSLLVYDGVVPPLLSCARTIGAQLDVLKENDNAQPQR